MANLSNLQYNNEELEDIQKSYKTENGIVLKDNVQILGQAEQALMTDIDTVEDWERAEHMAQSILQK